jgi:hypothetical protein
MDRLRELARWSLSGPSASSTCAESPGHPEAAVEFFCLKVHSQIPRNYDYDDHDADDVKNVHCVLRRSMRDFDLKTPSSEPKRSHVD